MAVARGDADAFARLYDALSPAVYGLVSRLVRDDNFAQDVTQEVFLEVWRIAPRYDPSLGKARSWVLTVAHRRAVDRIRSEQASRDREDRTTIGGDDRSVLNLTEDEAIEQLHLQGERRRVLAALSQLPEAQRQAIEIAYFDGLTYSQVATYLDVPIGTVKSRIRDGLHRLRRALEEVP